MNEKESKKYTVKHLIEELQSWTKINEIEVTSFRIFMKSPEGMRISMTSPSKATRANRIEQLLKEGKV